MMESVEAESKQLMASLRIGSTDVLKCRKQSESKREIVLWIARVMCPWHNWRI
jgi:hypothetical protein